VNQNLVQMYQELYQDNQAVMHMYQDVHIMALVVLLQLDVVVIQHQE